MKQFEEIFRLKRPLCYICLVFIIILIIATKAGPPTQDRYISNLKGKTVTIRGKIVNRAIKNNVMQIYIKNLDYDKKCVGELPGDSSSIEGVILYLSDYSDYKEAVYLGRVIDIKGVFSPFAPPENEGQFDQVSYYKIRGYDGSVKRGRIEKMSYSYDYVAEGLRRIRDSFEEVFAEYLSEEESGIMDAMILGDKSELDTEIKEQYQNAGISHILALSGLHIAAVGLAISKLLRKIGISKTYSSIISGVIISAYACLTGLSISTQRALIMFILASIATLCGRTYDLITAAAISSIIILFINPYYIYDSGFLLSFLAVVGIGIVNPILSEEMSGLTKLFKKLFQSSVNNISKATSKTTSKEASKVELGTRVVGGTVSDECIDNDGETIVDATDEVMPSEFISNSIDSLLKSICASVSITITTLPVVASSFYQLSIYSIFLNLIVIPLMSMVLLTGFVGGSLGLIEKYILKIYGGRGVINRIIFYITHLILSIYKYLTEVVVKLKGNIIVTGKPNLIQIITYVTIVIFLLLMGYKSLKTKAFTKKHGNKITLVQLIAFAAALCIIGMHPREKLEIRNLSVGQGDCAYICGRDLPVVMIDGGSSDIKAVGKYRIIPALKSNGIEEIDYFFLTHFDLDHISSVFELLSDDENVIRVNNIVVSEKAYQYEQNNPSENFLKLSDGIERKGVNLLLIGKGDVLDCGDIKFTCLHPEREENGRLNGTSTINYDANENSIVLSVEVFEDNNSECFFNALFTGDIGEDTEREIINNLARDNHEMQYTYLKVAHHGSRYSSSEQFLSEISPRISVISVGADNSYGHPHKETMERLDKYAGRAKVYRTDESGQITVIVGDDKVVVKKFKENE